MKLQGAVIIGSQTNGKYFDIIVNTVSYLFYI